jgi:hypothetical protein
MSRNYFLIVFILITGFCTLGQVQLPSEGVDLSDNQLNAFQEAAEKKKNQFIKCVERITRNNDIEIRKANVDLGINLFADTAHIQVSNIRLNTIKPYTVIDYFKTVVWNYHNPSKPVAISFQADPVIIDKINKDKDGNLISIEGHFTFTQNFCKCNPSNELQKSELKEYKLCYCDRTKKTGLITIKPIDSPTGLTWIVLLTGIVVNETTEK